MKRLVGPPLHDAVRRLLNSGGGLYTTPRHRPAPVGPTVLWSFDPATDPLGTLTALSSPAPTIVNDRLRCAATPVVNESYGEAVLPSTTTGVYSLRCTWQVVDLNSPAPLDDLPAGSALRALGGPYVTFLGYEGPGQWRLYSRPPGQLAGTSTALSPQPIIGDDTVLDLTFGTIDGVSVARCHLGGVLAAEIIAEADFGLPVQVAVRLGAEQWGAAALTLDYRRASVAVGYQG